VLFEPSSVRAVAALVCAALAVLAGSRPGARDGVVLWSDGMEKGSLTHWYWPATGRFDDFGGGIYNSGPGRTVVSRHVAHTGRYSAKQIYGGGFSGTRLFRWRELDMHRAVTISQWMYIPAVPTVTRWWWLQEFKTKRGSDGNNQASWVIDTYNPSPGSLRGRLSWVLNDYDPSTAGPHAGEFGDRHYVARADFPIRRWFKSTLYIKQSNRFDGEIMWWIGGRLQASLRHVRTAWPSTSRGNSWQTDMGYASISYGRGLRPAPFAIYIDDVTIRKGAPPRSARETTSGRAASSRSPGSSRRG
jgi:hypothetical protein